jgi:hypothetical protein
MFLSLLAFADDQNDEVLFTIPRATVLSAESSSLKSRLPELETLDSWMKLILVMLYENQLPSSPWREYFGNSSLTQLIQMSSPRPLIHPCSGQMKNYHN